MLSPDSLLVATIHQGVVQTDIPTQSSYVDVLAPPLLVLSLLPSKFNLVLINWLIDSYYFACIVSACIASTYVVSNSRLYHFQLCYFSCQVMLSCKSVCTAQDWFMVHDNLPIHFTKLLIFRCPDTKFLRGLWNWTKQRLHLGVNCKVKANKTFKFAQKECWKAKGSVW